MRVITGKARGVQLKTPEGMLTRPTADRVKEALFSIINFDLRVPLYWICLPVPVSWVLRRSAAVQIVLCLSMPVKMPAKLFVRIYGAQSLKIRRGLFAVTIWNICAAARKSLTSFCLTLLMLRFFFKMH